MVGALATVESFLARAVLQVISLHSETMPVSARPHAVEDDIVNIDTLPNDPMATRPDTGAWGNCFTRREKAGKVRIILNNLSPIAEEGNPAVVVQRAWRPHAVRVVRLTDHGCLDHSLEIAGVDLRLSFPVNIVDRDVLRRIRELLQRADAMQVVIADIRPHTAQVKCRELGARRKSGSAWIQYLVAANREKLGVLDEQVVGHELKAEPQKMPGSDIPDGRQKGSLGEFDPEIRWCVTSR
jgi:hypothetical protein